MLRNSNCSKPNIHVVAESSKIINYPNLGRNVETVGDRRWGGGWRNCVRGLRRGCLEGSRCAPSLLAYSAWTLTVYPFTQQFPRSLHTFYYIYKESLQCVLFVLFVLTTGIFEGVKDAEKLKWAWAK